MSCRLASLFRFDNRCLRDLPVDSGPSVSPRDVSGAIFSLVRPSPLQSPRLVALSPSVLQESLAVPSAALADSEALAAVLSGNAALSGSQPAAHCYAGHQFGSFSGQLGDGAAMYLGEVLGTRGKRCELQLKGAGPTPYSRQADGRKVLRSSVREFLASEAMAGLGIPTTRAAAVVTSDTRIQRDPLYSGKIVMERASVVARVAQTFFRFGSFEIFNKKDPRTGREGPSSNEEIRKELLPKLVDFTIKNYFPEIEQGRIDLFFNEVVRRTARLVADWQCVGFCHGVLNTDNMSIVGLTIDYGPFAFMDYFDKKHICNGSDDFGRYSYENQPHICKWNCGKLAEALSDLLSNELAQFALNQYDEWFQTRYVENMRKKFGLLVPMDMDTDLIQDWFETLHQTGGEFTNCFRILHYFNLDDGGNLDEVTEKLVLQSCPIDTYKLRFKPRVHPQQLVMLMRAHQQNPSALDSFGIPPSFLYDELERNENLSKMESMTSELKQEQDRRLWNAWLYKYKNRVELDLSKSDMEKEEWSQARSSTMKAANPVITLRNWMAQEAIEKAENGDYSQVQRLLDRVLDPFSGPMIFEPGSSESFAQCPPTWARDLCITCSS